MSSPLEGKSVDLLHTRPSQNTWSRPSPHEGETGVGKLLLSQRTGTTEVSSTLYLRSTGLSSLSFRLRANRHRRCKKFSGSFMYGTLLLSHLKWLFFSRISHKRLRKNFLGRSHNINVRVSPLRSIFNRIKDSERNDCQIVKKVVFYLKINLTYIHQFRVLFIRVVIIFKCVVSLPTSSMNLNEY